MPVCSNVVYVSSNVVSVCSNAVPVCRNVVYVCSNTVRCLLIVKRVDDDGEDNEEKLFEKIARRQSARKDVNVRHTSSLPLYVQRCRRC